jgi:hypothetical protein
MRVPNFPLAPSPDQFCPHHHHGLINMDDASSQLCQFRLSCKRQRQLSSCTILQACVVAKFKGLRSGKRKALRACSHQTLTKRLTVCAALGLLWWSYEATVYAYDDQKLLFPRTVALQPQLLPVPVWMRRIFSCFSSRSSRLLSCTVACHELTQDHALCK